MKLRRFYSIQQIEFCRNFVFKRNFPIHKIFERSCEMGLWEMTAHKISEVFGPRITKQLKGSTLRSNRSNMAITCGWRIPQVP